MSNRLFSKMAFSLIISLLFIGVISSQVLGLPPPPPSGPGIPPDENTCVATNGGIEICDSIDNDCNGSFDEGVCTSESNSTNNSTEPTAETTTGSSTSTAGGRSSGGGGGGGSGGGNSGVIFFPTTTTSTNDADTSNINTDSGTISENTKTTTSDSKSSTENSVDSNIKTESDRTNMILLKEFISSNYKKFLINSSIILVVTLLGILLVVKIRNHINSTRGSKSNSNNLNPREIVASKYISQMRTNNYSENDIRASMKKSGWSEEEINKLTKK